MSTTCAKDGGANSATTKLPPPSQDYRDNFDSIFRTKPKVGSAKEKDLRYSAYSRCQCGCGLAYIPDVTDYWDCSAILKGTADHSVIHSGKMPFTFYEIKSENQPSAHGATTRPTT